MTQENQLSHFDFYNSLHQLTMELKNKPLKSETKTNEFAGGAEYLPISRVESKLDYWFPLLWQTDNFSWNTIANEIVCSIQLWIYNPFLQQWITRTGVGATQIQYRKGTQDLTDVNNKIQNTLQKDFPAAKAEALKNAAKSLGETFGRELNRGDTEEAATSLDIPEYRERLNKAKTYKQLTEIFKGLPKDAQATKDIQSFFKSKKLELQYQSKKKQKGGKNG